MLNEERLKRAQVFFRSAQLSVFRRTDRRQLPRCDVVCKLKIEPCVPAPVRVRAGSQSMVSGKSCRKRGVLIAPDFVTMFNAPGLMVTRFGRLRTSETELIVVSTATDAASTVTISVAVPTEVQN